MLGRATQVCSLRHCVHQGALDFGAVGVPPLGLIRFRLELWDNHSRLFFCHTQNPSALRYRFDSRLPAAKAVIGRIAAPRIVQITTSTRMRLVWPTWVYLSSPAAISTARSIGSFAN